LARPFTLEAAELPIRDLPALLHEKLGIQTVIDYKSLDDVGVAADAATGVAVEKMLAGEALFHLLRPLDLTWMVANEVLVITTPEQAEVARELRVYPVRDFYVPGDEACGEAFDDLIGAISSAIAPDTWDEVGGPGAIEPFATAGVLVISQTAEIHAKIEDLLVQLRKKLSEERDSPAAAVKADPNALHLVIYDLPHPAPQIPAQQPAHDGGVQQPAAPGGGLFQFGGGFGGVGAGPPIPSDDLVAIVTSLVEPESWKREGVYINAVAGRLIVRNTTAVHRQVKALLVKLGLRSPWDEGGFGGSPYPVVGRR
jgi:hypothetical protein